jgi:hypothetical protein
MDTTTQRERMAYLSALAAKKRLEITQGQIVPVSQELQRNPQLVKTSNSFRVSMDDILWCELAYKRHFRLPSHQQACTKQNMKHWLRKLKLSTEWFCDWTGMEELMEWPESNLKCGLRIFVGLLLEELE